MHLVEIFLPLYDNEGARFGPGEFAEIRKVLADKFGGLTAFNRAPADGLEKRHGHARHDELIVIEIMTDRIDRDWWQAYRQRLETIFRQHRILIRACDVTVL